MEAYRELLGERPGCPEGGGAVVNAQSKEDLCPRGSRRAGFWDLPPTIEGIKEPQHLLHELTQDHPAGPIWYCPLSPGAGALGAPG